MIQLTKDMDLGIPVLLSESYFEYFAENTDKHEFDRQLNNNRAYVVCHEEEVVREKSCPDIDRDKNMFGVDFVFRQKMDRNDFVAPPSDNVYKLEECQKDALLQGINLLRSATNRDPNQMGRAESEKRWKNLSKLCGVEIDFQSATDNATYFVPTVTESPLVSGADKKNKKEVKVHLDWPCCDFITSSTLNFTPPTNSFKYPTTSQSQLLTDQVLSESVLRKEPSKNSRKFPLLKKQFEPLSQLENESYSPSLSEWMRDLWESSVNCPEILTIDSYLQKCQEANDFEKKDDSKNVSKSSKKRLYVSETIHNLKLQEAAPVRNICSEVESVPTKVGSGPRKGHSKPAKYSFIQKDYGPKFLLCNQW